MKVNVGNDLYLKGRIGWKGLSKSEYLETSEYRIINGYSLKDGYIDWGIAGYISKDRYEESPEIKLQINDILISKDGTIGKVGIVRKLNKPSSVASGIFVLRNIIQDKLDTEYLFQFLKSSNFKNFINRVKASGSTINHLYQRDLSQLEIDVPDINEQKIIGKVLKNLDEKIELNKRLNDELEALAKTIYDYWFVQFDFPDENGKPYKSSGGKMVYNEELKREIPEGWEAGGFDDLGYIVGGTTPSKSNAKNFSQKKQDTPWITPKDLSLNTDKKYISRGEFDVTDQGIKDGSLKIMPAGTILLTSRAPIGYVAIARLETTTNQGFKSIVPKNNFSSEYIYYTVKLYVDAMKQYASGSTFKEISGTVLKMIKIPLPEKIIVKRFTDRMTKIFEQQNNLELQNQELSDMRDWLLPMLMNGQVRVGEVNENFTKDSKEFGKDIKSEYS